MNDVDGLAAQVMRQEASKRVSIPPGQTPACVGVAGLQVELLILADELARRGREAHLSTGLEELLPQISDRAAELRLMGDWENPGMLPLVEGGRAGLRETASGAAWGGGAHAAAYP